MHLKHKKSIILSFFIAFLLVFVLPFLVVTEFKDSVFSINIPSPSSVDSVKKYSGYQVGYLMILQMLFFITLSIWLFAKNKLAFFISVVTSFLNILCLPWMFIVLTFNIDIDPPYSTNDAGIGFYLLVILNLALFFFSIWFSIKSPKKIKESNNLIDDTI